MKVFLSLDLAQLSLTELETLIADARAEISTRQLPPLISEEVVLLSTRPIEAIKLYRARVGCGLRDAKDMIERARRGATHG